MKQVVAAWSLGIVLCVALYECATSLPSIADLASYKESQDTCVEEASTHANADTCRALVHTSFCSRWPASCDGGAE